MNLDRRLLSEARAVRTYLLLTVGIGLLTALAIVSQAAYLSGVVTAVFLEHSSLDGVRGPLAILLGIILARAGLTCLREVLASEAAARVKADLRNRLFARLLVLGPLRASGERTGELTNTLLEGVESLDAYFSQYLPNLALAAVVPLAILLFVFPIDLLSGIVFLVTAPLIPLFMILIGKLAELLTARQWESLSRLNAHFLDVLQGLSTLKLFNRSKAQVETIGRVTDQFRDTTLGVLRVAFLSALVLEIVGSISTAIVAVEVGLRLLYSGIGFEQALFILVLAPEFYLPLRALGASFHAGMSGEAAAKRIYEVLEPGEGGSESARERGRDQGPIPPSLPPSSVEFRNVSLSYDSVDRPALKGVSFEIKAGEQVALVGPSGAGKSSLASLLLRFADPEDGEILVDGCPLSQIPADPWRTLVSWVPQNPYLFAGTVEDNIRMGRPGATLAEVEDASKLARADEFIRSLPDGYETQIGERGARLSGGQAQRISLARAFLKDAPILVMDEPTSNLDPETEAEVREGMRRLAKGRMVLVIAHRLSTVQSSDQIVVLDDGRVAETGTHEQLLARHGLYSRLIAAHSGNGGWGMEDGETGRQEDGVPGRSRTDRLATSPSGGVTGAPTTSSTIGPSPIPYPLSLNTQHPTPNTSAWRVLFHLLRLLAPFRWWMALTAILGFATVGAGIGLIATAAFLIASAALHPSVADLAVPIVGVRFFGISRGVFRYLERYVSHNVTFRLLGRLRVWFYEAIEPLAPARLMYEQSGDLLSRVVSDVEALQHFYVRVVSPPLVAIMVGIAMWLFLQQFALAPALVFLVFYLLAGLVLPVVVHLLSKGAGAEMSRVRSEMSVCIVDGIQGMADLLVYGEDARKRGALARLGDRLTALQGCVARISGLHNGLAVLLSNSAVLAVLITTIPLISSGALDGVYLPVLALAALASFEAVAPVPLAFQHLGSSLESGHRLLGVTRSGSTGIEQVDGDRGWGMGDGEGYPPALITHHSSLITIRNLRFRYGPSEPWVLDHISLDLDEGKRIALVGASGAGKSTLAGLLVRFYDCYEGSIKLLGRELREWSPESAREQISLVPQRAHLFNTNLRDNLMLARPGATEDEMLGAARRAGLDTFVQKLPERYETPAGEQGLRLSGGERQRVAITRALLRDPRLLILDEPASNLDSLTEQEVLGSILEGSQDQAILIITHRLVSLEAVDEILVLHGGRIVERGSHWDLLGSHGIYRRMWDQQQSMLPT